MQIEKGRVGQFFLFVGLIMLVVFFLTDQSQNPQVLLFFGGAAITFLGVYLIWRDWKPPEPSNRFRILKRNSKSKKNIGDRGS